MTVHCSNPMCSAPARAGFSFDPRTRVVWICDLFDLGPQGQPLCERHADKLRPPQGWAREDRRIDARGTDWAHGTADLGDRPDGRLLRRAFRLPGDDHPERWSLPGEADTEPA